MKQNISFLLILVFLLITTSHTSSRKLKEMKSNNKSVTEMEDTDSFPNLMGSEECGNGDEECLNRRILADAHLDYIYTQQHKP